MKGNEDDKIHHRRSLEDLIDPLIMIIDPNGDVLEEWKQTNKENKNPTLFLYLGHYCIIAEQEQEVVRKGREKAGGGRTDNKPNMPGQAAPNNTVKIRQLKIFFNYISKKKRKRTHSMSS